MNTPKSEHPMEERLRRAKPKADAVFLQALATQIDTAVSAKEKNMQATLSLPKNYLSRVWQGLVAALGVILFAGAIIVLSLSRPDNSLNAVMITPTVSPQTPDCTVEPQTGWMVHQVEANTTLEEIAKTYEVNANTLAQANCLRENDTLPEFVYIPLHSQLALMTNQPIKAGTTVDATMLGQVWVSSATELPLTMLTIEELANYLTIFDLPPYTVLNDRKLIMLDFPANEGKVKLDIPIDFDPKLAHLEIGDTFTIAVYFEMCREPEHQNTVIPRVVNCHNEIAFSFTPTLLAVVDPTTITIEVSQTEASILQGAIKLEQEVMMVTGETTNQEDWVTVDVPLPKDFTNTWINVGDELVVVVDVHFCHTTNELEICATHVSGTLNPTAMKNLVLGELVSVLLSVDDPALPTVIQVKVSPEDAVLLEWAVEAEVPLSFIPVGTKE